MSIVALVPQAIEYVWYFVDRHVVSRRPLGRGPNLAQKTRKPWGCARRERRLMTATQPVWEELVAPIAWKYSAEEIRCAIYLKRSSFTRRSTRSRRCGVRRGRSYGDASTSARTWTMGT